MMKCTGLFSGPSEWPPLGFGPGLVQGCRMVGAPVADFPVGIGNKFGNFSLPSMYVLHTGCLIFYV